MIAGNGREEEDRSRSRRWRLRLSGGGEGDKGGETIATQAALLWDGKDHAAANIRELLHPPVTYARAHTHKHTYTHTHTNGETEAEARERDREREREAEREGGKEGRGGSKTRPVSPRQEIL